MECKSPVLQALSTRQDSELPGSSATGDKDKIKDPTEEKELMA